MKKSHIKHMRYVFQRPVSDHIWSDAFLEMDARIGTGGDFNKRSWSIVAANWQIDGRVSSGREGEMLLHDSFRDKPDAEEWPEQVREYFSKTLCLPAAPVAPGMPESAYRLDSNANNTVPAAQRPTPHDQLLHVGSVHRMLRRAVKNMGESATDLVFHGLFGRTPPVATLSGITSADGTFIPQTRSLCEEIEAIGPEAVKAFARFLANGQGNNEPPWWATVAVDVGRHIRAKQWPALAQALGLGHLQAGETLVFWQYDVETAGELYRPTVVEANDSPWHFPSMPSKACGITMALTSTAADAAREYLHAPLRGMAAFDNCSGFFASLAEDVVSEHSKLEQFRRRHVNLLRKEVATDVDTTWLDLVVTKCP